MRLAPIVVPFLLAGCGPWNPSKDSGTTTGAEDCVDSGFVKAKSGSMTITQLVYNSSALVAGFDEDANYDEWGPAGCYNPTTGEFQWIFESGGSPVGALRALGTVEGGQGLDGALGGTFRFDFYDDDAIETSFQNHEFVDGTYTVNSLDPFQVTIIGSANDNGATMTVSVTARAEAP